MDAILLDQIQAACSKVVITIDKEDVEAKVQRLAKYHGHAPIPYQMVQSWNKMIASKTIYSVEMHLTESKCVNIFAGSTMHEALVEAHANLHLLGLVD